jgi:hypothetical protein
MAEAARLSLGSLGAPSGTGIFWPICSFLPVLARILADTGDLLSVLYAYFALTLRLLAPKSV